MYSNYREQIENTLREVFNVSDNSYYTLEELEYKARDGFIPFIDGGFNISRTVYLDYLTGSGCRLGVKDFDNAVENMSADAYEEAKKEFMEKHPEISEGMANYHDLYNAGKGDLAEELSMLESDFNDGFAYLEFTVHYYDKGNSKSDMSDRDSLYVCCAYNFVEYGRNKYAKVIFQRTISAKSIKTLKKLAEKAHGLFENIRD